MLIHIVKHQSKGSINLEKQLYFIPFFTLTDSQCYGCYYRSSKHEKDLRIQEDLSTHGKGLSDLYNSKIYGLIIYHNKVSLLVSLENGK